MELFEIEERLCKESQTYTPNIYGNLVAAAQAEGLLTASAVSAAGGSTAAGSTVSGESAAVNATAALNFKKVLLIFASAMAAVAIAVGSITTAVVLNSDVSGGGNATAGNGTEEGIDGDDEHGGDDNGGEETKITTYVGLTYKFQLVYPPIPPAASEEEADEINMIVGRYFNWFFESTITFPTEDSFTIVEERGTTHTGAVEKTEFDYQINLNVKDIPLPSEDGYLYVTFNKNYATNEIQYESIDVKVVPEGKTYYDIITLHFTLEK